MMGKVTIKLNDDIILEKENLIVNSGVEQIAKLLNGFSSAYFTYMGIGSSSSLPSSTQVALGNQIEIVKTTNSLGTTRVSNDTCNFQGTFSFSTTYTVTEIGLFTSSTSGTMLNRTLIGAVNVDKTIDLSINWQIIVY
jgi:hypothetical protein